MKKYDANDVFWMGDVFADLCEKDGFNHWWEAEAEWPRYETLMIEAGAPEDEVADFFSEMCEDL